MTHGQSWHDLTVRSVIFTAYPTQIDELVTAMHTSERCVHIQFPCFFLCVMVIVHMQPDIALFMHPYLFTDVCSVCVRTNCREDMAKQEVVCG
jgi:hypothetical protein